MPLEIDERRGDYFVNNVVCGRHIYITILRNAGILDRWFSDEKKKNTVFVLLKSISQELNSEDIAFIKKYSFLNEEDDKQFRGCFGHDIINESDELFELRMLFYNKYPEWSQELYIDVRAMMKHCESRMIRLISFWLKNKIKSKGKSVYRYEEEIIAETDPYLLQEGKYILDELIQYIPLQSEDKLYYSDWSAKFLHHRGLESSKILFLIDTDVQFKQVNKPLELSGGKKNNIFIRRLQLDNGEIRLIDPTILNNTYAQTEIEDCLIPKIYYDSLVDVINVVGTEKEKEIMTKYAFVTDAKQSRLKGDNSCIVVTDISYVQKKQIIVDFAENSDNKYLIARKYTEKYKQSLDREPHKLQIAISRCFDI